MIPKISRTVKPGLTGHFFAGVRRLHGGQIIMLWVIALAAFAWLIFHTFGQFLLIALVLVTWIWFGRTRTTT